MVMYSGAAFGEASELDKVRIPERDEIEAMNDHGTLWALLDEFEMVSIRIEICLKFPGDYDRDWFFRARSALIKFRIGARHVERRLKVLEKSRPGPAIAAIAPRAAT